MPIEHRIKRWLYEAERRGLRLERILIHPKDAAEARRQFPWLPIKVLGWS